MFTMNSQLFNQSVLWMCLSEVLLYVWKVMTSLFFSSNSVVCSSSQWPTILFGSSNKVTMMTLTTVTVIKTIQNYFIPTTNDLNQQSSTVNKAPHLQKDPKYHKRTETLKVQMKIQSKLLTTAASASQWYCGNCRKGCCISHIEDATPALGHLGSAALSS